MKTFRHAALALALAGTTATAQAGVIASAVNTSFWSPPSAASSFVSLTASGATTLSFTLAAPGKKVLTFSAICSVDAPVGDTLSWLDLDILVNGVVLAPTVGSDDAFCSAHGIGGFYNLVRPSITIPIKGISGNNTIQIMARGNYNASDLSFHYSTLVVFD